jgi:LPPG:FO 2-phospho-L-lactate transferase
MKLVALAGGVGGAKFADGLARALRLSQGSRLTVIVNTGDDFDWMGLRICPDLDTVMYTLAGLANPQTGWGIEGDTAEALGMLGRLGGETWFHIGDRDLAVHLRRTQLLRDGERLSDVTEALARSLGIGPGVRILPMTDADVSTVVETGEGALAFQDYFVRRAWQPEVLRIIFRGAERARPTAEVLDALDDADLVVLCPSNPFVSVDPILALDGVRARLRENRTIAVSPLIGGQAVKGPAAKMFRELGMEPTVLAVARRYADVLDGYVMDRADASQQADVEQLHMRVLVTDVLMRDPADRARLAREVIEFARTIPA